MNPTRTVTDVSRASFTEVEASWSQQCSCQCGQLIKKGQRVFARPFSDHGKIRGASRLIDLDEHYASWLETAAKAYAEVAAKRDRRFRDYLEGK